ncbi:hypothetical protein KSS87_004225 [Heliosperma pusillum]|nr:hypothetical protein KSS87_004225 [Heliosperma pusillum]
MIPLELLEFTAVVKAKKAAQTTPSFTMGSESPVVDSNGNSFDFTTKLLHLAWHPSENSIACAAANSLYMYYA